MLVLARYWVSGVASATSPTPFFMLSTLVALARPSETPAPLLFGGCVVLTAAGTVSGSERRHRVHGAPRRLSESRRSCRRWRDHELAAI